MLQIREKQYHQTKVLALAGQFCPNTNTGIQARILGAKQMGYQHVILDLDRKSVV